MNETTVRLLWAAAGLLLVSGCIFASLSLWRCAACEALIVKERKLFYHKRSEETRNGCLPASFFGQPS